MKFITILIFIFSFNLYSQEINFQLYLKGCDSSITKSWFHSLKKNGIEYEIESKDNPIIKVPKPGIYTLTSQGINEVYEIIIDKKSPNDTLNYFPIYKKVKPIKIDEYGNCVECITLYQRCIEPLNGTNYDHYNNGNIKLQGSFKNGIPIGEIVEYYQNGVIKSKLTYNSDGKLENELYFNANGIVIEK